MCRHFFDNMLLFEYMYTELLNKLGFDDKEIAVFITVLERGRVAPAAVSTITGIKRSTVYSVAKSLMERGVLHIDTSSEPAYLVVESGEVLENLISKQEIKLNEERKTVAETIRLLENIPKSKNYSVPKIRFYNERELEPALYDRTKYWQESAVSTNEPLVWGFQDPLWFEKYPEWVKYYWDNAPKELGSRYLMDIRSKETKKKQTFGNNRLIKYIDTKKHSFSTTNIVLGDYILYIVANEKPYYMIEIHDRVMAHNLREVFKMLWEKV